MPESSTPTTTLEPAPAAADTTQASPQALVPGKPEEVRGLGGVELPEPIGGDREDLGVLGQPLAPAGRSGGPRSHWSRW